MSKRPYRRYVTAGCKPVETPNRSVALACACCGHTSTVSLTIEAMTDLPRHCGQPMLINTTAPAPGARRPSALL